MAKQITVIPDTTEVVVASVKQTGVCAWEVYFIERGRPGRETYMTFRSEK